jgi:tripeptidyl-peptidase II
MQEVVYDKGVIFVASAGNSGPGLTTCGAPGGTSESIISVGAFVSPSFAGAGHAAREGALPEGWLGQQYNWSSRGERHDLRCPPPCSDSLPVRSLVVEACP